ncbi:MAG: ABC transporter ATP-binding protein [Candidatus Woesearchaeota archaeon]
MERHCLLKITNLTKIYGNRLVLNNINLDIEEGEILGIVGPSGAGKTTLLECVVGFTKPEQGDILLGVKNHNLGEVFIPTKKERDSSKFFGFAAQFPSFYNQLSVRENLYYFGSLYGIKKETIKHNAEILINLLGLAGEGDTIAGTLSGGMQKRLDIACAMVHGPRILILDEPTADLDPISRKQMIELIKKINLNGTTIIMASHMLQEIEEICEKVAVLHEHKIQAVDSPQSLKNKYNAKNLDSVFEAIIK